MTCVLTVVVPWTFAFEMLCGVNVPFSSSFGGVGCRRWFAEVEPVIHSQCSLSSLDIWQQPANWPGMVTEVDGQKRCIHLYWLCDIECHELLCCASFNHRSSAVSSNIGEQCRPAQLSLWHLARKSAKHVLAALAHGRSLGLDLVVDDVLKTRSSPITTEFGTDDRLGEVRCAQVATLCLVSLFDCHAGFGGDLGISQAHVASSWLDSGSCFEGMLGSSGTLLIIYNAASRCMSNMSRLWPACAAILGVVSSVFCRFSLDLFL